MDWILPTAVIIVFAIICGLVIWWSVKKRYRAPTPTEPVGFSEEQAVRIYERSVAYTEFLNQELDMFRAGRKRQ